MIAQSRASAGVDAPIFAGNSPLHTRAGYVVTLSPSRSRP